MNSYINKENAFNMIPEFRDNCLALIQQLTNYDDVSNYWACSQLVKWLDATILYPMVIYHLYIIVFNDKINALQNCSTEVQQSNDIQSETPIRWKIWWMNTLNRQWTIRVLYTYTYGKSRLVKCSDDSYTSNIRWQHPID